jgi:hypothetical protein
VTSDPGDLEHYLTSLGRLLERVEQELQPDPGRGPPGDRIRSAIKQRHGDWQRFVVGSRAEHLGHLFVGLFEEADRDPSISPEQVRELEARADERLPHNP